VKNFFLIGSVILGWIFSSCLTTPEANKKELLQVAREINEKCPKMLDSETRLDGIEVRDPNTLVYKYTLVNFLAQNIDTAQFYHAMWPGIISTVRVSPEMKKLRENDTDIEYFYQDKAGKTIYTFRISPGDYK
jgi:hypothetical protein